MLILYVLSGSILSVLVTVLVICHFLVAVIWLKLTCHIFYFAISVTVNLNNTVHQSACWRRCHVNRATVTDISRCCCVIVIVGEQCCEARCTD